MNIEFYVTPAHAVLFFAPFLVALNFLLAWLNMNLPVTKIPLFNEIALL